MRDDSVFISRESVEAWEREQDFRHLQTPEIVPPVCRYSYGQEKDLPEFIIEKL